MKVRSIPVCQSCGMPLQNGGDFGTNSDGSINSEFCRHCYQNGKFTDPKMDMKGMTDHVARIGVEMMGMTEEQAREKAERIIPTLRRWQTRFEKPH